MSDRAGHRRYVSWFSTTAMVLFGALVCAGCGEGGAPMRFVHDAETELEEVEVTCEVERELSGSVAARLAIRNTSSAGLSDVILILNDEYRCELGQLFVFGGFFEGSQPLGRSTLRPDETLEFVFSHDTANRGVMRRSDGQALPSSVEPVRVMLEAATPLRVDVGRWDRP